MPPKRKRAAEDTAAEPKQTRATRSSARNKATTASDTMEGTSAGVVDPEVAMEPAPKKQRKAPAKTTSKKARSNGAKVAGPSNGDDALEPTAGASADDTTSTATKNSKPAAKVQRSADPSKPEPYSPSRAADLYSTYADDDDQGVIGPEELEKLFGDAGISLEGSLPLLLAWLFGSTEMAKVTKAEWEKGTAGLRISSLPALSAALTDLENLLVHDKPPLKPAQTTPSSKKNTSSSDPYDRSQYFRLAHDPKKAFLEFYLFVYTLSKPPQSRNIEIETACALWSVILAPRYPMVDDIISFINEKGTYKAVTKDLWSMMLEFCQTVSPNLDDYDPEAAWPTLLDDYVSTKKSKVDGAPSNANAI